MGGLHASMEKGKEQKRDGLCLTLEAELQRWSCTPFLYKNQLYKNSEPQNGSKIKNNLRTNRGSKSSPTKKIEYLAKINTKNKNNLRTFEPCCASIIKNIEPRPKISGSYKKKVYH